MAGVKGQKGSGGRREGAGRPPAAPVIRQLDEAEEAEKFLLSVINDQGADLRLRLDAAKALLPYQKPKLAEQGKKESKAEAAAAISSGGKFAIPSAPKLTLVRSA